MTAPPSA